MIRLTGCRNMAELQEYTKGSFRNLIEEGEREQVEESIWQQIGGGHSNDYVHFHLRKADGTSLRVLDHGRIVEKWTIRQSVLCTDGGLEFYKAALQGCILKTVKYDKKRKRYRMMKKKINHYRNGNGIFGPGLFGGCGQTEVKQDNAITNSSEEGKEEGTAEEKRINRNH